MISSKHDNLWELLNKYNFDLEVKQFRDLRCVICKKLMVNAHQSCCGCRYCFDCIQNYLKDSKRLCPGKADECKEQMITISDVQIDHVANVKISKIPVTCPEAFCQFTDELRKIEDHINSHQLKCPYFDIGCNKPDLNKPNIEVHLNNDHSSHAALLMDSIQNMKNEIASLRENSSKKDCVILTTQNQLERMRVMNNGYNDLVEVLGKSIDEGQSIIRTLQIEVGTLNKELKNVKETIKKKESQINALQQKVGKIAKESKGTSGKIQEQNQNTVVKSRKPKSKIENNKVSIPIEFPNKLNRDIYSPFQWKIGNFSMKKKSANDFFNNSFILSEPFYSHENGYKMCLTLYPDGSVVSKNAWLCVGFHIMQGEYDNFLQWPMMMYVTIGLVDQKSEAIHLSKTYHYYSTSDKNRFRFFKPTIGMNNICGSHQFISLNGIINNQRLYKNDSIIIKCFVEMVLNQFCSGPNTPNRLINITDVDDF